jgi:hypothetical protein
MGGYDGKVFFFKTQQAVSLSGRTDRRSAKIPFLHTGGVQK